VKSHAGDSILKGHVLVAEDVLDNSTTITAMLSIIGITSEVVTNGHEAVAAINAGRHYDCILMDMNMPLMGGIEATGAIRRLEASKGEGPMTRCPIIGVTANAYPENRECCMAAGMDGFLAKPVEIASLQAELSRYLPVGKPTALPAPAPAPAPSTAPAAAAAALEPVRLLALIDELQQLIAQHMFVAMQKYEELQALLGESPAHAGLSPVGELLQQLKFQAAGALLRQWRSQHGFDT
jgi:CheY-like chemotaxis protein